MQKANSASSAGSFGLQQKKLQPRSRCLKARKLALKFLKFKALNAKSTGVFTGVFQPNF